MIDIKISCSKEASITLTQFLKNYSCRFIEQVNSSTLFIKEISTAKDIRDLAKVKETTACDVVCILNQSDDIFEILELRPVGLLRKQALNKDMEVLAQLIEDKEKHRERIVEFKSGNMLVRINATHITYIESYQHYLEIHTINGTFKVRERLSGALDKLKAFDFVQIHKSYLVNMQYVASTSSSAYFLNDGTKLPVGRKFKIM